MGPTTDPVIWSTRYFMHIYSAQSKRVIRLLRFPPLFFFESNNVGGVALTLNNFICPAMLPMHFLSKNALVSEILKVYLF
jgi:hypothetical protein